MARRRGIRFADRVMGPLEGLAVGFAAYLTKLGYSASTVSRQSWLMAELSSWLEAEGINVAFLSPTVVERFAAPLPGGGSCRRSARAAVPLRGLGAVAGSWERPLDTQAAVLAEYRRFLADQRQLREVTIDAYAAYAGNSCRRWASHCRSAWPP